MFDTSTSGGGQRSFAMGAIIHVALFGWMLSKSIFGCADIVDVGRDPSRRSTRRDAGDAGLGKTR